MNDKEFLSQVSNVIGQMDKKFGKGALMPLNDDSIAGIEVVDAGLMSLNMALGGGYPVGRVIEIYGPESSGKTTLSIHAMAEFQKAGKITAVVDAEHAFDKFYAQNLGVNTDQLLISQPDNGEQALEIVDALVSSGKIGLVVIDSVAALTPKAEIDGEMGDSKMGLQARLMSQALRKITGKAHRNNCTLIFINQLREKIGVMFGNPETTTGGNALKYYSSIRIDVRRIGQNKDAASNEVVSNKTRVKVVKNKIAPPFRQSEFNIVFGEGVDKVADLIDIAVNVDIVKKSGSWYSYGDIKLGQGSAGVKGLLLDNSELYDEIYEKVIEKINN